MWYSSPLSAAPSSSSSLPSSPTTSSFYRPSTSSHRPHQSRASSRRLTNSSPSSSHSSTSLHAQLLEQNRLARQSARSVSTGKNRELDVEVAWWEAGNVGPGGMKGGMWEENTEEEELQIGRKLRWEMKRKMEEADEWDGVMLEEEEDEEDYEKNQEEPPDDFLDQLSSYSPPPSHHPSPAPTITDTDGDEEMDLDLDVNSSGTIRPSFTTSVTVKTALLSNPCPSCKEALFEDTGGDSVRCTSCAWGLGNGTVESLNQLFEGHLNSSDANSHTPTVWWSEYTGTIVLCSGCDETFAA